MLLSVLIVARIFRVIHPSSAILSTALKHRMITQLFSIWHSLTVQSFPSWHTAPWQFLTARLLRNMAVQMQQTLLQQIQHRLILTQQVQVQVCTSWQAIHLILKSFLRRTLTTGVSLQMLTNMSSRSSRMPIHRWWHYLQVTLILPWTWQMIQCLNWQATMLPRLTLQQRQLVSFWWIWTKNTAALFLIQRYSRLSVKHWITQVSRQSSVKAQRHLIPSSRMVSWVQKDSALQITLILTRQNSF